MKRDPELVRTTKLEWKVEKLRAASAAAHVAIEQQTTVAAIRQQLVVDLVTILRWYEDGRETVAGQAALRRAKVLYPEL